MKGSYFVGLIVLNGSWGVKHVSTAIKVFALKMFLHLFMNDRILHWYMFSLSTNKMVVYSAQDTSCRRDIWS